MTEKPHSPWDRDPPRNPAVMLREAQRITRPHRCPTDAPFDERITQQRLWTLAKLSLHIQGQYIRPTASPAFHQWPGVERGRGSPHFPSSVG